MSKGNWKDNNLLKFMEEDESNIEGVSYEQEFINFCKEEGFESIGENEFVYTPYHDYQDTGLSGTQVIKILDSENPYDTLTDVLYSDFSRFDYDWDNISENFKTYLDNKGIDSDFDLFDVDSCGFYVQDILSIEDDKFYLEQEYKCRIEVDAGDANYDFSLNPYYANIELNDEAGLVWLVKQQGHTKEELANALEVEKSSNGFINSCVREIENTTSSLNRLTFLCTATLNQLCDCKANKRAIKLDKSAVCGLFEPWNGAGSLLEIELEKDVEIPADMVFRFIPDSKSVRGYGYSVEETYGMLGSAYDTEVELIDNFSEELSEDKNKKEV